MEYTSQPYCNWVTLDLSNVLKESSRPMSFRPPPPAFIHSLIKKMGVEHFWAEMKWKYCYWFIRTVFIFLAVVNLIVVYWFLGSIDQHCSLSHPWRAPCLQSPCFNFVHMGRPLIHGLWFCPDWKPKYNCHLRLDNLVTWQNQIVAFSVFL